MSSVDHTFRAMGCDLRVAASARGRSTEELASAAARVEAFVRAAAARLTRFDARSELRGTRPGGHPASPLLRRAVTVALRAARASGGLLDPTLGSAVSHAGYATTFDHARRAALPDVLAAAPPRRAARPKPVAVWQQVTVDDARGELSLPAGVTLDLGATAKGLIADLALRLLGPVDHGFVDAGGDLALHAPTSSVVLAADPFDRPPVELTHAAGAVGIATSSIAARSWWQPDGRPAHHLLDPSTGRSAFTGIVQVTAAAPSTADAERLAGQALLGGPRMAPRLLATHGGLVVLDDATTLRIEGALLR